MQAVFPAAKRYGTPADVVFPWVGKLASARHVNEWDFERLTDFPGFVPFSGIFHPPPTRQEEEQVSPVIRRFCTTKLVDF